MSHLNEICNIHLAYVRFLKKKKMHRFALIVLSFVNTCIKKKKFKLQFYVMLQERRAYLVYELLTRGSNF